jgi:hypothetical protein
VVVKIVIAIILWSLAGAAEAVMETLQFHFSISVFADKNPLFWNPKESWRNKYKDGDPNKGPKFFLSTSSLVFLTDGFHLAQFIQLSAIRTSLVLLASTFLTIPYTPLWNAAVWAGIWIALVLPFSGAFHLLYSYLLVKKRYR